MLRHTAVKSQRGRGERPPRLWQSGSGGAPPVRHGYAFFAAQGATCCLFILFLQVYIRNIPLWNQESWRNYLVSCNEQASMHRLVACPKPFRTDASFVQCFFCQTQKLGMFLLSEGDCHFTNRTFHFNKGSWFNIPLMRMAVRGTGPPTVNPTSWIALLLVLISSGVRYLFVSQSMQAVMTGRYSLLGQSTNLAKKCYNVSM